MGKSKAAAPWFPWRPATDIELDNIATEWRAVGRTKDMEILDVLYSAWTHRPAAAPGHWSRLQRKLNTVITMRSRRSADA